ncbi:MAG TPA: hypothetical protein VNR51_11110, partial [Hyphomicrobium sp.]|nr:hypothetical protein [Hyphomicrobium sp.]
MLLAHMGGPQQQVEAEFHEGFLPEVSLNGGAAARVAACCLCGPLPGARAMGDTVSIAPIFRHPVRDTG